MVQNSLDNFFTSRLKSKPMQSIRRFFAFYFYYGFLFPVAVGSA